MTTVSGERMSQGGAGTEKKSYARVGVAAGLVVVLCLTWISVRSDRAIRGESIQAAESIAAPQITRAETRCELAVSATARFGVPRRKSSWRHSDSGTAQGIYMAEYSMQNGFGATVNGAIMCNYDPNSGNADVVFIAR